MTKKEEMVEIAVNKAHVLGCIAGMYLDSKAFGRLNKKHKWSESEYSYWLGHNHALEKIKDAILND